MPSLGIAPHPEGCVSPAYMLTQDAAPVSGVFPAGASFLPAGDWGSGNPAFSHITRVPQRAVPYAWARPLLSWHAIVPFRFSLPGKPSDPGTSLRVPPGYAGDITERLAAQTRQKSVFGQGEKSGSGARLDDYSWVRRRFLLC